MPYARRATARSTTVGRSTVPLLKAGVGLLAVVALSFAAALIPAAAASGAAAPSVVSVSNADASVVNPRGFAAPGDVYVTSGDCPGSATPRAVTLPDGEYAFVVSTSGSGARLSSDGVSERGFTVVGGAIVSTTGGHATHPRSCASDPSGGPITMGLAPFDKSPVTDPTYRLLVAPRSQVEACLAAGDPTGFGCSTVDARATTFTIAGSITSSVSAQASPAEVAIGAAVTDHVTVGDSSGAPTGTVVFYVCEGTFCPAGGRYVGSANLDAGSATSPAYLPTVAGTFTFRAEYWGDSVYAASADGGTNQTFTVTSGASASPGSSPSGSSPLSSGPTSSPTVSGSPGGTAGPTSSPTRTPTPQPTPTRTAAATPASTTTAPQPTGTPPPWRPPVTAAPTPIPTNNPWGCSTAVCYLVSPTFFGPGWDQSPGGSSSPGAISRTPNESAVSAYGSGGVPHFPGINAPATPAPSGGVAGAVGQGGSTGSGAPASPQPPEIPGSSQDASGEPGSSGIETTTDIEAVPDGMPTGAVPSTNAEALGAGAAGAGTSQPPVGAAAGIATPDSSAAGAEAAGTATSVPATSARSSTSLAMVILALLVVGVLVAVWALRSRRPRILIVQDRRD